MTDSTAPPLLIPACGKSTTVYHNEVGFIVFCVNRQNHTGAHHADVAWEDEPTLAPTHNPYGHHTTQHEIDEAFDE